MMNVYNIRESRESAAEGSKMIGRFPRHATWLTLTILLIPGCNGKPESAMPSTEAPLTALSALGAKAGNAILAQGQLAPSGGILSVVAPPGDRVVQMHVSEGQWVDQGQTLGRLESYHVRQIELAVAESKLREAESKLAAEQAVARARLEVAKIELQKAEWTMRQSTEQWEQAELPGGKLELAGQRVRLAENQLSQLRRAVADTTAPRIVSAATIDQQELEVNQAKSDLQAARREAESAIETGRLAVAAATQEILATELAIESAVASSPLESIRKQIELLEVQLSMSELKSPIAGRVMAIDVGPGEATTGLSILRIADTQSMICRVDMNVADLPRVKPGGRATITSAAFSGVMGGDVTEISSLIGSPRLPDPNPLTRTDWRSVEVIIHLDPESSEKAADLIHLQVDVAIQAHSPAVEL